MVNVIALSAVYAEFMPWSGQANDYDRYLLLGVACSIKELGVGLR